MATRTETMTLAGLTVGITAARRADEFATLLRRHGAHIEHTPTIRIIPLANDAQLEEISRDFITTPPDYTVATTGIGFRGWVEAADNWGLAEDLVSALKSTHVIARGPKAKGAVRAAGLQEEWSPPNESSSEVLEYLLDRGVSGKRIAVQMHGATTEWEPLPAFTHIVRSSGAVIVPIPVYRWITPEPLSHIDNFIKKIIDREIDALSFTSAPAVASLLGRAKETDQLEALLEVLRSEQVIVFSVGPVTSGPLDLVKVPSLQPGRARLGALARLIAQELPRRRAPIRVGDHDLAVRGAGVVVDEELIPLSPASTALLRELARRPGIVVGRARLLSVLPGGSSDVHAVETAIARLRQVLPVPGLIQTVVKRGYRLAVDLYEDD